tara:strand:+ start:107 stop:883 length:777 start_codon:yes stop_codon:yes gene_type:complete
MTTKGEIKGSNWVYPGILIGIVAIFTSYFLFIPAVLCIVYAQYQVNQQKKPMTYEEEYKLWEKDVEYAEALIAGLKNYQDLVDETTESPIVTKQGEELLLVVEGAALVETRRQRGSYQGGSQGLSLRVAKGVSYRVAGYRGTYEPGPEEPTVIDTGVFVVSNTRAVFTGSKQNREFHWSKLIAFTVETIGKERLVINLPVSNRQKVSGIGADTETIETIQERIAFGISLMQGKEDAFIQNLRDQLHQLKQNAPTKSIS